ncbi:hypothetical protein EV207_11712 [Scopulibacillus darangshiensis]|uniref:Uncharacterized protein n=1 Tax=Scopulibacillus darangshiensis TaxID=442528 RepID=A0A4R2P271_9BACL|nr:hypothetical protein [Scopulibacillus darangshiensis]TCP27785.1 hypothetical protein EV207_11712 [Scopulibacillus darangshiensis]
MILTVSALLVLIYSGICLWKVYRNRNSLGNMTRMTIAMVLGMISSLDIGLIAGVVFKSDLSLSTIIAMSFGFIVGFLVGKPTNLLVTVEGVAAGIMGGMMGAMLGVMLPHDNFRFILVFLDILFILSVLSIVFLINTELETKKDNSNLFPHSYPWIITSVISTIIIFTFAHLETASVGDNNQKNREQHHHQTMDEK